MGLQEMHRDVLGLMHCTMYSVVQYTCHRKCTGDTTFYLGKFERILDATLAGE